MVCPSIKLLVVRKLTGRSVLIPEKAGPAGPRPPTRPWTRPRPTTTTRPVVAAARPRIAAASSASADAEVVAGDAPAVTIITGLGPLDVRTVPTAMETPPKGRGRPFPDGPVTARNSESSKVLGVTPEPFRRRTAAGTPKKKRVKREWEHTLGIHTNTAGILLKNECVEKNFHLPLFQFRMMCRPYSLHTCGVSLLEVSVDIVVERCPLRPHYATFTYVLAGGFKRT